MHLGLPSVRTRLGAPSPGLSAGLRCVLSAPERPAPHGFLRERPAAPSAASVVFAQPATGAGGGAARHLLAEPGSLASGSRQGVRPADAGRRPSPARRPSTLLRAPRAPSRGEVPGRTKRCRCPARTRIPIAVAGKWHSRHRGASGARRSPLRDARRGRQMGNRAVRAEIRAAYEAALPPTPPGRRGFPPLDFARGALSRVEGRASEPGPARPRGAPRAAAGRRRGALQAPPPTPARGPWSRGSRSRRRRRARRRARRSRTRR